ncbi:MAG TPA: cytochrome c peroxidase [Candidatus Kapabacteria bacterium]|nr:cytochrome c peroxidase [Candidatus Kapabacteria bacterium]
MGHTTCSTSNRIIRSFSFVVVFVGLTLLSSCKKDDSTPPTSNNNNQNNPTDLPSPIPVHAPAIQYPADNQINTSDPTNDPKVALGRLLFYDGRLSIASGNGSDSNFSAMNGVSCGSCHIPGNSFTDPKHNQLSFGINHTIGVRNAPNLTNVAYNKAFTWDGKFTTLEQHVPGPMFSSIEMGNNFSRFSNDTTANGYGSSPGTNDTMFLFKRLQQPGVTQGPSHKSVNYADYFKAAFGTQEISLDRIVKAIASFERTFISTSSPFDAYNAGSANAISASAKHGFQLFINPDGANCVACHSGYNFTNGEFRNNGLIPSDQDPGRFKISKSPTDINSFKVPSLRNVALSYPYMHDGRFATLEDVLAHYNSGGSGQTNHDSHIKPLHLSQQDISDIVEFLKTLTDVSFTSNPAFVNPWTE